VLSVHGQRFPRKAGSALANNWLTIFKYGQNSIFCPSEMKQSLWDCPFGSSGGRTDMALANTTDTDGVYGHQNGGLRMSVEMAETDTTEMSVRKDGHRPSESSDRCAYARADGLWSVRRRYARSSSQDWMSLIRCCMWFRLVAGDTN
jgi:hypothetical protein